MVSLLLSLPLLSSNKVHESQIFISCLALFFTAFNTFEVSAIEETVSHKKISTKELSSSISSS